MDAQNYYDWSKLSGLYLNNRSHLDRYQTFEPLLSAAGLTTIIVSEFLNDSQPDLNVVSWRTHSICEMSAEAEKRVEMTAIALGRIGAVQTATAVREAKSTSPFDAMMQLFQGGMANPDDISKLFGGVKGIDLLGHLRQNVLRNMPDVAAAAGIKPQAASTGNANSSEAKGGEAGDHAAHESSQEIQQLLETFVTAHQTELQSDLDKHGDPRTMPGFTREGRFEELEAIRIRHYDTIFQIESVSKIDELIGKIGKLTAAQDSSERRQLKIEQRRREFRDLLQQCKARSPKGGIPELTSALTRADEFTKLQPELFAPPKTADAAAMTRLQALGEFETDVSRNKITYQWNAPIGFECEWTRFTLNFSVPKDKPEKLTSMLDACDRLKQEFASLSDDWREQLLSSFRDVYYVQLSDWELEDYELDDEGEPTNAGILKKVEVASISITNQRKGLVVGETFFSVEWDDEHGFPIEWQLDAVASAKKPSAKSKVKQKEQDLLDLMARLQANRGEEAPAPVQRGQEPDVPGIATLHQASKSLATGLSLRLSFQIKSPPVSDIEKRLYHACHFELIIDINEQSLTIRDMQSPRQTYLSAKPWPAILFAPIVQWPELTLLWDSINIHEFDINQAMKKRKYVPASRPDLTLAATEAMKQAVNAKEAEIRNIRVNER